MENSIKITQVQSKGNRLDIKYHVEGEWSQFFNLKEHFFVEYNENIENIPYGIAIIPFMCNILPIAWLCDARIYLEEIDEDFYNSIKTFKQGYIDMYPKLDFLGSIEANQIKEYSIITSDKSLAFFSGGVDAFYTLLSHINEKPAIATMWGADIKLDDAIGWRKVINHTNETAEIYNLDAKWMKSNFRTFIKEGPLTQLVVEKANDGWWHGFQHGIGLIGHAAPLMYQNNISKLYIAASFTIHEKGKVTCASDPTIDNYVKFCGCTVKHDGYEASRQDKIEFICRFSRESKKQIPLRVCWESSGGSNCCKCEKCYRTLFGILAEKEDPRNYGFDYTDQEFKRINSDLKNIIIVRISNWNYIQQKLRKNFMLEELPRELHWFYKINIEKLNHTFGKRKNSFKYRARCFVYKVKRKVIG